MGFLTVHKEARQGGVARGGPPATKPKCRRRFLSEIGFHSGYNENSGSGCATATFREKTTYSILFSRSGQRHKRLQRTAMLSASSCIRNSTHAMQLQLPSCYCPVGEMNTVQLEPVLPPTPTKTKNILTVFVCPLSFPLIWFSFCWGDLVSNNMCRQRAQNTMPPMRHMTSDDWTIYLDLFSMLESITLRLEAIARDAQQGPKAPNALVPVVGLHRPQVILATKSIKLSTST